MICLYFDLLILVPITFSSRVALRSSAFVCGLYPWYHVPGSVNDAHSFHSPPYVSPHMQVTRFIISIQQFQYWGSGIRKPWAYIPLDSPQTSSKRKYCVCSVYVSIHTNEYYLTFISYMLAHTLGLCSQVWQSRRRRFLKYHF